MLHYEHPLIVMQHVKMKQKDTTLQNIV